MIKLIVKSIERITSEFILNILNVIFMHNIKTNLAPNVLFSSFDKPSHSYSTRFSSTSYIKPKPS